MGTTQIVPKRVKGAFAPAPIRERHEFSAVRIPARPVGPTGDDYAAIRATAKLPGGIDRTICSACGMRAWDHAVPLAGMCLACWREWFDAREAA